MNIPYLPLIVAAAIVVALVFLPTVRRIVFFVIRLGIALGAAVVAVLGIALLMNNETVWEKPGAEARIVHFLTVNQAASSDKGLGSARCRWPDQPTPTATPTPAPSASRPAVQEAAGESAGNGGAAGAAATPGAGDEDVYPELITRSYPGISRQQLFQLSKGIIDSLGGWKIEKTDPRSYTLDCIYTTRMFGWQDDVRITITPKSEVQLCSRSETARPNATSMLRFLPGDFGSNIGHIKQFYEALEPKMDEVYKREQERENAKKPGAMR